MEYQRKRQPDHSNILPSRPDLQSTHTDPMPVQRAMQRFTSTPTTAQRQAVIPVLRAASLRRQEEEHLSAQRLPLQRQVTDLSATLPADAIQTALQRQASEHSPTAVPTHPQRAGEWVTVMRHRAEQVEGNRLDARSTQAFTALQRQVTAALVHSVKHDSSPAIQRHAAFAQHAVSLQRHALTRTIPRAALAQLPPGERLSLQRAVDEATQADALQRQQDQQALTLHSLQRQLAELDEQATKPVMKRIQARRGGGNPLPAAVQRHLEQGLNHDLSAVRIHDDAEADKLAKGVNATAFTTGTDIYFRSGRFNPNTQSGLELLAHEVTHTVQQSQGKVGKGIDPDPDLEQEARAMGKRLALMPVKEVQTLRKMRVGSPSSVQVQRLQALTPSRPWKQVHAFSGTLNAAGVELSVSINSFQVFANGVVVGKFKAPNGTGRLDGFMDSAGNIYWTAKYEAGLLKGQSRRFHGRMIQKVGGLPSQLKGTWLGQDEHEQASAYQMTMVPNAASNNGSDQTQENLINASTIVFSGYYKLNTAKISITIHPGGEIIGYLQDKLDTPREGFNHSGNYLDPLNGNLTGKSLNFSTQSGKKFSGTLLKNNGVLSIKDEKFNFTQTGDVVSGLVRPLDAPVKPKTRDLTGSTSMAKLVFGAESFSPRPYDDGAGNLTIGFGHMMSPSEIVRYKANPNGYLISRAEAERLYIVDAAPKINSVNRALKVQLTQSEFDALVSLCYNTGEANFSQLDLIKRLNRAETQREISLILMQEVPRVFKIRDAKDLDGDGSTTDYVGLRGLTIRRGDELTHALSGAGNVPAVAQSSNTNSYVANQNLARYSVKIFGMEDKIINASSYTTDVDYPMVHKTLSGSTYASQQLVDRIAASRGIQVKLGDTVKHSAAEFTATGADYGGRSWVHTGWDFNRASGNADRGDPVTASSDGIVIYAGTKSDSFGYFVILEHPQLGLWTRYAHMSKDLAVSAGYEVKKGGLLGRVSNTGDPSMATHLHFDVIKTRPTQPNMWNGNNNAQRLKFVQQNYLDPYLFFKGKVDDIK